MGWVNQHISRKRIFILTITGAIRPRGSYIEAKDWIMERFVGSSINLERISLKSSINYSGVPNNRRGWNNRGGGGVDNVIIINNRGVWSNKEGWTGLKK